MTIRGLDADAADSILLDLAFPAAVRPVGDGFVRRPARLARARRLCPPTRQSPLANPQSRSVRRSSPFLTMEHAVPADPGGPVCRASTVTDIFELLRNPCACAAIVSQVRD